MVIYEVNVSIDNKIYADYYRWLIPHVKDILKIEGFTQAEISKETIEQDQFTQLTIRYELKSEADLENYLQNHASTLRADAKARFGDYFTITRRILTEPLLITL